MRIAPLLLAALAATAPAAPPAAPATELHQKFVSVITLHLHQAPASSWIGADPTWQLTGADMNPIVTNPAARDHYAALVEADVDHDSPWALVVHAAEGSTLVAAAPHGEFSPEGGPPQVQLEFLVRMGPEVRALELRHGETSVRTWQRPATPPPTPDLEGHCDLPASSRPGRCEFSWTRPPEGTWVQLMLHEQAGRWVPGGGGWREARVAEGGAAAHFMSARGEVLGELTFTDGFHCVARRARTRP